MTGNGELWMHRSKYVQVLTCRKGQENTPLKIFFHLSPERWVIVIKFQFIPDKGNKQHTQRSAGKKNDALGNASSLIWMTGAEKRFDSKENGGKRWVGETEEMSWGAYLPDQVVCISLWRLLEIPLPGGRQGAGSKMVAKKTIRRWIWTYWLLNLTCMM
jgi:hypothetical protein